MRAYLIAALLACLLMLGPAARGLSVDVDSAGRATYQWETLYLPQYNEEYQPDSAPVLAFGHAKEDRERAFRVCVYVEGDGELLLTYGGEGDGALFSLAQPEDVCTMAYVGPGGGGKHANRLDLYLFQRGERAVTMWRPEIKVGVLP